MRIGVPAAWGWIGVTGRPYTQGCRDCGRPDRDVEVVVECGHEVEAGPWGVPGRA